MLLYGAYIIYDLIFNQISSDLQLQKNDRCDCTDNSVFFSFMLLKLDFMKLLNLSCSAIQKTPIQ